MFLCAPDHFVVGFSPAPTTYSEVAMAKDKSAGRPRTVNKSAVTGRFVSKRTIKSKPRTTYKQTVKK
jgi:hypothetical protein